MTDGDALLAAIIAQPDDDTVRLAYADWLQENGRGERAEFVRVQCELARIPDPPVVPERGSPADEILTALEGLGEWRRQWSPTYYMLRARERELWIGGALYDILDHEGRPVPDAVVHLGRDLPGFAPSVPEAYVSRGFVSAVTCASADWLAHGDAIRAAHPVTEVTLTTLPLVEGNEASDPASLRWWLIGDKPESEAEFSDAEIDAEIGREVEANNGARQPNGEWLRALCRLRWKGVRFTFAVPVSAGVSCYEIVPGEPPAPSRRLRTFLVSGTDDPAEATRAPGIGNGREHPDDPRYRARAFVAEQWNGAWRVRVEYELESAAPPAQ